MKYFVDDASGKFYVSGENPPGGRDASPDEITAFYASRAVPAVVAALQKALDEKAQERGYDDVKSACAYASPVPAVAGDNPNFAGCEKFRTEGNALQAWMSLTWAMCYAYLATVHAGTNPMPTPAEAVAMMPVFTWPD